MHEHTGCSGSCQINKHIYINPVTTPWYLTVRTYNPPQNHHRCNEKCRMHEFTRRAKNRVLIFQSAAAHFSNCGALFEMCVLCLGGHRAHSAYRQPPVTQVGEKKRAMSCSWISPFVLRIHFASINTCKGVTLAVCGGFLFFFLVLLFSWSGGRERMKISINVRGVVVDKVRLGTLHLGAVTNHELTLISLWVCVCCTSVSPHTHTHTTWENNKWTSLLMNLDLYLCLAVFVPLLVGLKKRGYNAAI